MWKPKLCDIFWVIVAKILAQSTGVWPLNTEFILEDCSDNLNDVTIANISKYRTIKCENTFSLMQELYRLPEITERPTKIKFYSSCSTMEMIDSFAFYLNLNYSIQYSEKCRLTHTMHENGDNVVNYLLDFFIQVVIALKTDSAVIIIDDDTGVSPLELQEEMSAANLQTKIIFLNGSTDQIMHIIDEMSVHFNFILSCNADNRQKLIAKAASSGLLAFPYTWFIASDNASSVTEMIDKLDVEYTYKLIVADSINPKYEKALKHKSTVTKIYLDGDDTPSVLRNRLNKLIRDAATMKPTTTRRNRPVRSRTTEELKDLVGYTFYSVRVACKGKVNTIRIGNWTFGSPLEINYPKTAVNGSLAECSFRIALYHQPPFIQLPYLENTPQENITGMDIDILKTLADILHFNYHLIPTNYTFLGQPQPGNNCWSGVMGLMMEGDIDFLLPTVAMTPLLHNVVDFTSRIMSMNAEFIIENPDALDVDMDDYIRPFSGGVWLMLTVVLIVTSVCLTFTYLISPFSNHGFQPQPYPFRWWGSFYSMMGALMQQGWYILPDYCSGRIVFASFCICCVLMVQYYSSLLISFLAVSVSTTPFKTVAELAANNAYKVGTLEASSYTEFLNTTTDVHLQKIWKKIMRHADANLVQTMEEGIEKAATEKYAFLLYSTFYDTLFRSNCSLISTIPNVLSTFSHIAVRKGFPYRDLFSTCLNRMRESGIIGQLYKKYNPTVASACIDDTHKAITFSNIYLPLYLLCGGLILGVVICFGEFAWYYLSKRMKKTTRTSKKHLHREKQQYETISSKKSQLHTVYLIKLNSF